MELLPVTELRQWTYCPRVVYYHLLMAGAGRATYKMEGGSTGARVGRGSGDATDVTGVRPNRGGATVRGLAQRQEDGVGG